MLQVTPRDPPERRPSSSRALRDPPNASWERPGPPQDHPRPPQSPPRPPLGNSIRQALNRKSTIFRFYTFFQPFFNTFHLRKLLCKIALISFYTYFQLILTIFRIAQVNQTPPRTPPGPPQDLPGPPSGPPQARKWPIQLVQNHKIHCSSYHIKRTGPAECAERLNPPPPAKSKEQGVLN